MNKIECLWNAVLGDRRAMNLGTVEGCQEAIRRWWAVEAQAETPEQRAHARHAVLNWAMCEKLLRQPAEPKPELRIVKG